MTDEDKDLTRQDEEIDLAHFTADEQRNARDFGNWPELAGVAFTALLIWLTFSFTG